jgi:Ca-activated chloride channel family protein
VNANARHSCVLILLALASIQIARADSAREAIRQGNRLFGDSKYSEAISKYDEALVEQPQALEPRFDKADSFYRMDDLGKAIDLYQEAAAGSKDMALVEKAKYNLGNCFFQRGAKQRDSDLQKAVEDMKTSITQWRQVLDIDPKNEKAAKNIEVARLTIKDLMDQLKKQQEQQKQQNQQNQQQPQQGQKNPNQPQDPNQAQKNTQPKEPNQPKDQQQSQPQKQEQQQDQQQAQQSQDKQEQGMVPDATAQEILDKEQQQKKEREMQQRGQYQQVEKDW